MSTKSTNGSAAPRHFLDIADFSGPELRHVLDASASLKARRRRGEVPAERPLAGKILAMVFDKPSTRTRVSFDVAMRELGGETVMLTGAEMQLGRGETIADTARVLSRYVDAIMIRTLDHGMLAELAAYASVPVINGLTKVSHPCQIMADVLTFEEHKGPIRGRTIAWTGDTNNVLASWVQAAARLDFRMRVATPAELAPGAELIAWAKREGVDLAVGHDPYEAVAEADAIVTDCWVSMGDEDESYRHNLLAPYQVNERLMMASSRDPIFMHCLPAHRGEEVTDEVMDGPRSVVFDEAENRLHAQKGILAWCFGATGAEREALSRA
jgi:ornithine carbamoyltransferase